MPTPQLLRHGERKPLFLPSLSIAKAVTKAERYPTGEETDAEVKCVCNSKHPWRELAKCSLRFLLNRCSSFFAPCLLNHPKIRLPATKLCSVLNQTKVIFLLNPMFSSVCWVWGFVYRLQKVLKVSENLHNTNNHGNCKKFLPSISNGMPLGE